MPWYFWVILLSLWSRINLLLRATGIENNLPEIGWSAEKDTRSATDGMKASSQSSEDLFSDHNKEFAVWVCKISSFVAYHYKNRLHLKSKKQQIIKKNNRASSSSHLYWSTWSLNFKQPYFTAEMILHKLQ